MLNGEAHTTTAKNPRRPPRRIKSLSEALDLLGTSFHNIYEKHIHHKSSSKNPSSSIKREKSKSQLQLSEELKANILESQNIVLRPSPFVQETDSSETNHKEKVKVEVESEPELEQKSEPEPDSEPQSESDQSEPEEPVKKLEKFQGKSMREQGSSKSQNKIGSPENGKKNAGRQKISLSTPRIEIEDSEANSENETPPRPHKRHEKKEKKKEASVSPKMPPKKMRDRSASMVWVDFLTEPGLTIEEESGDDGRRASQSTSTKRKIWFGKHTESEIDDEDPDVCCSENGGSRKPSIRSNKSPEPQTPPAGQHQNVDDLIYDMFREKDEDIVIVGKFLAALEKTGLRKTDPRLLELFENLRKTHRDQEAAHPKRNIGSIETLSLDRETFKIVITDNIVLISRAFRQQFIIPEFQTFCGQIEDLFKKCKDVKGGKQAGYIPQLARVDGNLWGVSVCTIDGQRYSIGDTQVPFTLQSCSKPLNYAIALNELGEQTVHQYVGQEPSGRMFNELVLDYNKKPHNPMVNAGAIIVCSLLKSMVRPEMTLAEKFDYTYDYFKRLGGGEFMGFNNAVFLSEREAADRNYALGFYMRENKCFPEGTNLKECMDYYFQCCSMETNCETASVMAATLSNGGVCPISGEKVLKSDSVRDVLSLMHSCGMYDYSGQFAFKVGLPAKSGVSGCILLVVPNVLGMAVYSPPLDSLGNTVRGVALCQELVEVFNFHKYDNLRHVSSKIDPRRHRYETKGLNIVNLLFSAASGDVTSMRRHHLSGMDMQASDYDGRTALHLASAEGHLECVDYLLRQCHVAYDPRDRWGHLPVDDADRFEHEDVAEFLRKWQEDQRSANNSSS